MRLRLKPWLWLLTCAGLVLGWLAARGPVEAGDRVTVRGNYYREASTRVLQPMVTFTKELPDEKLVIEAEYLLDAISSASIGAGAEVLGGDVVFTELRHETSARIGSKLGAWSLGGFFKYSTETDYRSRAFGVSLARELWQKNVTLSLSYAANLDSIFRIVPGDKVPWESTGDTNLLKVHYLGLGYTQTFHKTVVAGVGLEGTLSNGPQDNPYRKVVNAEAERHPLERKRIAPNAWVRWMVVPKHLTLEPMYRFYRDDWGITAHSFDGRVHLRFLDHWRFRMRYRYYTQSGASFWREDNQYLTTDAYITADPKMSEFHSHTPGAQLTWELDGLAGRSDKLGWLRGAWIQATYNHVIQTNRFGNARLGSLAFSLAF